MKTYTDKTTEKKSESAANDLSYKHNGTVSAFQFKDNRPEVLTQRKLQGLANTNAKQQQPIQKKENKTGLPDQLKSGIETLSGHAMDDVKVHYNSSQPAKVQAHAYAQGSNIHLASGQEKHLPHEAWHVVQQAQGRVKPTTTVAGMAVNDNVALEKEADVMGGKAMQMKYDAKLITSELASTNSKETKQLSVIQLNGKTAIIKLSNKAKDHFKHHSDKYLPSSGPSLIDYIREEFDNFEYKGEGEWVLDLDEYETNSGSGTVYKMWTIILVEIGDEGEENYLVKHYGPSKSK